MNLSTLTIQLLDILKEDSRLATVFLDDVYRSWNDTNTKYFSAVLDFESSNFYGEYVDRTFVLYVGNVISENEKNIYQSYSIAESVINNFLHKIDTLEDSDMILVIPDTVTPFSQQFADVLAGCWCRFTVRIPIEIICEE